MTTPAFATVDPLELPDWLGSSTSVWRSESGVAARTYLRGELVSDAGQTQSLDLLAVDAAYPRVVCPPQQRHDAHQAWHFGEVLLLESDDRVLAAVPATEFDANLVCTAIARVAHAIGVESKQFQVVITL